jgi:hypothetical protein
MSKRQQAKPKANPKPTKNAKKSVISLLPVRLGR